MNPFPGFPGRAQPVFRPAVAGAPAGFAGQAVAANVNARGGDGDDAIGCGPQCTLSHASHGNCLRCGRGWGNHGGHNCNNGVRGSWLIIKGCDKDCTMTHYKDDDCLTCRNPWGLHGGHMCINGSRGSWYVKKSQAVLGGSATVELKGTPSLTDGKKDIVVGDRIIITNPGLSYTTHGSFPDQLNVRHDIGYREGVNPSRIDDTGVVLSVITIASNTLQGQANSKTIGAIRLDKDQSIVIIAIDGGVIFDSTSSKEAAISSSKESASAKLAADAPEKRGIFTDIKPAKSAFFDGSSSNSNSNSNTSLSTPHSLINAGNFQCMKCNMHGPSHQTLERSCRFCRWCELCCKKAEGCTFAPSEKEIESNTIFGSIFANTQISNQYHQPVSMSSGDLQKNSGIGFSSFHFESPDYCYINYQNNNDGSTLDSGISLPARKVFIDPVFDEAKRQFTGFLDWTPDTLRKAARSEYVITFSNDLTGIVVGTSMRQVDANGNSIGGSTSASLFSYRKYLKGKSIFPFGSSNKRRNDPLSVDSSAITSFDDKNNVVMTSSNDPDDLDEVNMLATAQSTQNIKPGSTFGSGFNKVGLTLKGNNPFLKSPSTAPSKDAIKIKLFGGTPKPSEKQNQMDKSAAPSPGADNDLLALASRTANIGNEPMVIGDLPQSASIAEAETPVLSYECRFCKVTGFKESCDSWDNNMASMPVEVALKHAMKCPRQAPANGDVKNLPAYTFDASGNFRPAHLSDPSVKTPVNCINGHPLKLSSDTSGFRSCNEPFDPNIWSEQSMEGGGGGGFGGGGWGGGGGLNRRVWTNKLTGGMQYEQPTGCRSRGDSNHRQNVSFGLQQGSFGSVAHQSLNNFLRWSCDQCDFNLCGDCYDYKNGSSSPSANTSLSAPGGFIISGQANDTTGTAPKRFTIGDSVELISTYKPVSESIPILKGHGIVTTVDQPLGFVGVRSVDGKHWQYQSSHLKLYTTGALPHNLFANRARAENLVINTNTSPNRNLFAKGNVFPSSKSIQALRHFPPPAASFSIPAPKFPLGVPTRKRDEEVKVDGVNIGSGDRLSFADTVGKHDLDFAAIDELKLLEGFQGLSGGNFSENPAASALVAIPTSPEVKVDETGLDPQDIEAIMREASCSRAQAVSALRSNDNDVVNAIMDIASGTVYELSPVLESKASPENDAPVPTGASLHGSTQVGSSDASDGPTSPSVSVSAILPTLEASIDPATDAKINEDDKAAHPLDSPSTAKSGSILSHDSALANASLGSTLSTPEAATILDASKELSADKREVNLSGNEETDDVVSDIWTCPSCTFDNKISFKSCAVCDSAKVSVDPPSQAASDGASSVKSGYVSESIAKLEAKLQSTPGVPIPAVFDPLPITLIADDGAVQKSSLLSQSDITLKCKDCADDLTFSLEMQQFYASKGISSSLSALCCQKCVDVKKSHGRGFPSSSSVFPIFNFDHSFPCAASVKSSNQGNPFAASITPSDHGNPFAAGLKSSGLDNPFAVGLFSPSCHGNPFSTTPSNHGNPFAASVKPKAFSLNPPAPLVSALPNSKPMSVVSGLQSPKDNIGIPIVEGAPSAPPAPPAALGGGVGGILLSKTAIGTVSLFGNPKELWICSACTFENKAGTSKCAVCLTNKAFGPVAEPSAPMPTFTKSSPFSFVHPADSGTAKSAPKIVFGAAGSKFNVPLLKPNEVKPAFYFKKPVFNTAPKIVNTESVTSVVVDPSQIFEALENGDANLVHKILVASPLVSSVTNEDGFTPIGFAIHKGDMAVVDRFLSVCPCPDVNVGPKAFLYDACESNNLDLLTRLLQIPNIDINRVGANGVLPVAVAIEKGFESIVKSLITYNPRRDFKASTFLKIYTSCLYKACELNDKSLVDKLLKYPYIDINTGIVALKSLESAMSTGFQLGAAPEKPKFGRASGTFRLGNDFKPVVGGSGVKNVCNSSNGLLEEISPISIAIEMNHDEIVDLLLTHAKTSELANPFNINAGIRSCLYLACKNRNLPLLDRLLSIPNINVDMVDGVSGLTPVGIAIENGSLDILDRLLAHDPIPKLYTGLKMGPISAFSKVSPILSVAFKNPIYLACEDNNIPLLERLLKFPSVDVNVSDSSGSTPVAIALEKGHTAIVDKLLAYKPPIEGGVDINKGNQGCLLLFNACKANDLDKIDRLLKFPYINIAGSTGSMRGTKAAIGLLKEDLTEDTSLGIAIANNFIEVIDRLLAFKGLSSLAFQSVLKHKHHLYDACESNNVALIDRLLKIQTINVNESKNISNPKSTSITFSNSKASDSSKENLCTPIGIALKKRHMEAVKLFLKRDPLFSPAIDINKCLDSDNCLYRAAENGDLEFVNCLLRFPKVNVDKKLDALPEGGYNSFLVASAEGYKEICEALLDYGANVDATNSKGDTALVIAAKKNDSDMVKFLISNGACLSIANNENLSFVDVVLLKAATDDGYLHLLNDIPVDWSTVMVDVTGRSPLFLSIESGSLTLVQFLVSKGVKLNATDKDRKHALKLCLEYGHHDIFDFLLSQGADVSIIDNNRETLLHLACRKEAYNVIEKIISSYKPLSQLRRFLGQQNVAGDTCLHMAVMVGNKQICDLLMSNGMNVDSTNGKGETALIVAMQKKNIDMVKFLISKNANLRIVDSDNQSFLHILLSIYSDSSLSLKKADPIRLHGATFPIASPLAKVRGVYLPTDEKCGGVYVYRKKGDSDLRMAFDSGNKKWTVLESRTKGSDACLISVAVDSICYPEDIPRSKQWELDFGNKADNEALSETVLEKCPCAGRHGSSSCQGTIGCQYGCKLKTIHMPGHTVDTNVSARAHLKFLRTDIAGIEPIEIKGLTAEMSPYAMKLNGIFDPYEEVHAGVSLYRKRGDPDTWLEYGGGNKKAWMVKSSKQKGAYKGYAYINVPSLCIPENAPQNTSWRVANTFLYSKTSAFAQKASRWSDAPDMKMVSLAASGSETAAALKHSDFFTISDNYSFGDSRLQIINCCATYDFSPEEQRLRKTNVTRSVDSESVADLLRLVFQNSSPDSFDVRGTSLLAVAVTLGLVDVCIVLCDFGVTIDSFDYKTKETPLHIAIRLKNTDLCKLLISRGADLNILDANFKSYLQLAVESNSADVCKVLLDPRNPNRYDPNERDLFLNIAVTLGLTDVCIVLCDSGVNVDSVDYKTKETPLHIAIRLKNTDLCKLLISKGADVSILDANFKSYLQLAVESNLIQVCKVLLGHNCAIDYVDSSGKSPLYCLVENVNKHNFAIDDVLYLVDRMLERGVNVNIKIFNLGLSIFQQLYTLKDDKYSKLFDMLLYSGLDSRNVGDFQNDLLKTAVYRSRIMNLLSIFFDQHIFLDASTLKDLVKALLEEAL